jgi:ABC-type nitrate/sulfonate/bicarbonate transport system permease component
MNEGGRAVGWRSSSEIDCERNPKHEPEDHQQSKPVADASLRNPLAVVAGVFKDEGVRAAAGIILGALLFWEIGVYVMGTPIYILPSPSRILMTLAAQPAYYAEATLVTLGEAFAGLLLGLTVALLVAVAVTLRPGMERGVMALAILVKSMPLAAIAPLLTIWLGFGVLPKIIITALLTFFPVLVNALVGLQSADNEMLDLLRSYRASAWQTLLHLRFWLALPYLFAALRVAAPLALVGAVIAEWTGASGGLGRVMWMAYSNLNLPYMFAAIFILSVAGAVTYFTIVWCERRLTPWRDRAPHT